MKKTHKKVLGLFGLGAVAVTTVIAATLPAPGASAATSTTMTDTINVRVVGYSSEIRIIAPTSESTSSSPEQEVKFDYQGVSNITIRLEYTDLDGATQSKVIDSTSMSEDEYGTYDKVFNLWELGLGYGDYVLTVEGSGATGADSDSVSFSYYPVDSSIEQNSQGGDGQGDGDENDSSDNGDYTINFDFDNSGEVEIIGADITISDQDGNVKKTIEVDPFPVDSIDVSLSDYGLPSGVYTITVRVAYRYNGKIYYRYFSYTVNYRAGSVKTPDTGGLGGLNISKTDYLITGLIIFGIVGVGSFSYIAKKSKKSPRKR